jgi:hypothetical protein
MLLTVEGVVWAVGLNSRGQLGLSLAAGTHFTGFASTKEQILAQKQQVLTLNQLAMPKQYLYSGTRVQILLWYQSTNTDAQAAAQTHTPQQLHEALSYKCMRPQATGA